MENKVRLKEKTFIVYPTNRFTGAVAPGIAVDAPEDKQSVAVELAKLKSRLSDFPETWLFI
jgi:hypothetical protein